MMQATVAKRTEKAKALSFPIRERAKGHVLADDQVYIPEWVGVKGLDRELVIADCSDVDEAVKALSTYRKRNVLLLIRYTDGSRVITACDMRTDRILASWTDNPPAMIKTEVSFFCLECGQEFLSEYGEQICSECAGIRA